MPQDKDPELTEEEMKKLLEQEIEETGPVPMYASTVDDVVMVAYAVAPVKEFPLVIKEHNKKATGMAYRDSKLVGGLRWKFETDDICYIIELVDSL